MIVATKDNMECVNSDAPNLMTLDPDLLRLLDPSVALRPRSMIRKAFTCIYLVAYMIIL